VEIELCSLQVKCYTQFGPLTSTLINLSQSCHQSTIVQMVAQILVATLKLSGFGTYMDLKSQIFVQTMTQTSQVVFRGPET
jgi:hypothetical protein